MNEQDKQAFEAALNYAKAQNDMAHVERFDVCDFRIGWNAALEYARGQEPVAWLFSDGTWTPIKSMGQDHNGEPVYFAPPTAQPVVEQEPRYWVHNFGDENGGEEFFDHPTGSDCPDCIPLYLEPPAQPSYAEQCQAEGWKAVSKTLDEVMPGWADKADSGMEAACTAIRKLVQQVALVPQNWTVFNSGAEVKSGLTFEDAWDFMTPERLARGWCAVCVADESNQPKAQPVQPAVNEQLLEALKDLLEFHIKSTGITPETIADKEKFEAFMKYVESREKEVREQAEAAIRAAEAAKGGV